MNLPHQKQKKHVCLPVCLIKKLECEWLELKKNNKSVERSKIKKALTTAGFCLFLSQRGVKNYTKTSPLTQVANGKGSRGMLCFPM